MSLRLITSVLICFLLLPSGHSYGNVSSLPSTKLPSTALQSSSSPEKASIERVTKPQDLKASIKAAINDSLQPFSGSVILLENGTPLLEFQKGQGISKDSSFVMASLSKQITATLILQAVDAGKLDLSRSLNSYLFDYATPGKTKLDDGIEANADQGATAFNPNRYDERITLHQLLSHTSGVDELGKANKFAPGSRFEYSNFGYSLLAQVLEKVNQLPFAEQIAQFSQANQLDGLYAQAGSLDSLQRKLASLAVGLDEADVPAPSALSSANLAPSDLVIDAALLPAGGLIATAATFASFQHKLHSGKLISPESYELMTHPHIKFKFLWPDMSYGYGLRINSDDGIVEYSHTGYLPGYMSMSLHYPEYHLDLVMLENISLNIKDINRVFELHSRIRQAIRSQLLGSKQTALSE
ncbi:beta-lactamase family protein [Shewanella sp. AS16]|uniref:serine hydrolase domain-containing protein n=1 Tax=Shewanella sp. AS16 TaxID=2907625 RepID=UPI001F34E870|nr:serine hydrolase domain-containing protein [Shewanella sp. AS16]MCE9687627.1 beta-lactamase family protein [Shewanella sp. AS16]